MNPTKSGTGFLTLNRLPPRLHVTADTEDFDEEIFKHLQEEGYDVTYLPFGTDAKAYRERLRHLADDLELGEAYAIIAYGQAAALCLDACIKPMPHLNALVAYYPTQISKPNAEYPPFLNLLVHLAGAQNFSPRFRSYSYPGTMPGFAESDLEEYRPAEARLAWSRSLGTVRKGFKQEVDLEPVWEQHLGLKFMHKNAIATMETMVPNAHINHVPTLTGGVNARDLLRFYKDFFIPCNPPTMRLRLLSRTMSVDHVVDEFILSFRHTQEIPWMLPGVPPTNKEVEIAMVSIVALRGGRLCHEHVYWDQASVLVQIGALDPNLVPEPLKSKGMKRLPVAGVESARKLAVETSIPSNELIPSWKKAPVQKGK